VNLPSGEFLLDDHGAASDGRMNLRSWIFPVGAECGVLSQTLLLVRLERFRKRVLRRNSWEGAIHAALLKTTNSVLVAAIR
jgi:hypothetical protein